MSKSTDPTNDATESRGDPFLAAGCHPSRHSSVADDPGRRPTAIGDALAGLWREATGRVKVIAGGQEFNLRFTTVALYGGLVVDLSQVPLGAVCQILGDEGMDYTATIVA